MRKRLAIAASLFVLVGLPGWFLLQSVGEVQADPTKTIPCGPTLSCFINEECCMSCPGRDGACFPKKVKCPPPPPFCPGMDTPDGAPVALATPDTAGDATVCSE